ncbi:unnamed protein product, partial [Ectocarpus sp. 13 AM-2016]
GSQAVVEVFLGDAEVWAAANPRGLLAEGKICGIYASKGGPFLFQFCCPWSCGSVVRTSIAAVQRLATFGCCSHASRRRPWVGRARRRRFRPGLKPADEGGLCEDDSSERPYPADSPPSLLPITAERGEHSCSGFVSFHMLALKLAK